MAGEEQEVVIREAGILFEQTVSSEAIHPWCVCVCVCVRVCARACVCVGGWDARANEREGESMREREGERERMREREWERERNLFPSAFGAQLPWRQKYAACSRQTRAASRGFSHPGTRVRHSTSARFNTGDRCRLLAARSAVRALHFCDASHHASAAGARDAVRSGWRAILRSRAGASHPASGTRRHLAARASLCARCIAGVAHSGYVRSPARRVWRRTRGSCPRGLRRDPCWFAPASVRSPRRAAKKPT